MKLREEQQRKIESLEGMIDSCFTYGGADKDNPNYGTYIQPYEEALGSKLFNTTYNNQLNKLKLKFKIVTNVYEDSEELNYNSLEEI